MSESTVAAARSPLEPEEEARANYYGLIGRLFHGTADAHWLAALGAHGERGEPAGSGALLEAWRGLQEACRSTAPADVRLEYDTLFVGVGRSEVPPYLSAYTRAFAPDRYLVQLRDRLGELGLARRMTASESEDHVAGVCEIMRRLIEGGHSLVDQRRFFEEFLYDGMAGFFAAVQNAPSARFYRNAATLGRVYLEIEKAAFAMIDASALDG